MSPKKLERLLKDCVGNSLSPDQDNVEKQKAQLLHDLLEEVLPADPVVLESLPTIVKHMYRELLPLAGESLGNLLRDPATEVATLEKIKEYGKRMAGLAESEIEQETAGTIYYAAIAGALVYHDCKITGYTYIELVRYFSSLIENEWIVPEMIQLFKKAREICNKKIRENTAE